MNFIENDDLFNLEPNIQVYSYPTKDGIVVMDIQLNLRYYNMSRTAD